MRKAIKVLAGLTLMAALPAMATTPGTQPKWVTGYYGGYFWDNADYQKPEHVDMTALTHFVFARIGPGGGKTGQPGEVVPGAGNAHDNRDVAQARHTTGPSRNSSSGARTRRASRR